MKKDEVTVSMVYDLVDKMRRELSGDINKLNAAFLELEAGRLTRAEVAIAALTAELAIKKSQERLIVGVISFIISALIGVAGIYFKK